MIAQRRQDQQAGAALLTVLLLITTLAVLALGLVEALARDIARAAHGRDRVQADWLARGAESYAEIALQRLFRAEGALTRLPASWADPGLILPVERGAVRVRLREASNCFNLNSLVRSEEGRWVGDDQAARQFRALLEALGLPAGEAQALSAAAQDWIDSDAAPRPAGAEDGRYALGRPGYRTGGTLMAERSELRVVAGFTPDIHARISPFMCAHPTTGLSQINLNTLTLAEAPLLVMLTGGRISGETARRLIEARPEQGYADLDRFWAQDELAALALSQPVRDQPALRSRYLRLITEVTLGSGIVIMDSLLEQRGGGTVRVVRRRFGWPDEYWPGGSGPGAPAPEAS